jgi:hypothetical protein
MPISPALRELLERFDALPDDAVVPSKLTAIIIGTSERTVRYHPQLKRIQIARGRYGFRVGDIRKLCRDGMAVRARRSRQQNLGCIGRTSQ